MVRAKLQALSVEEFANTITHGFGLFLSVIGFIALVVLACVRGEPILIAGCLVYGLSLVVLYGASTIYHGTTSQLLKKKLQVVDHCCIYLLIAGTYTPFGLAIGAESLKFSMLGAIWGIAVVGILLKLLIGNRFPALFVSSYLVMGWIGAIAMPDLFHTLGTTPVALAVAGGLAYSLGVVFFPWKSIRHHHAIFHVFVLVGSVLHYAAIVVAVVSPLASV
jgi:hemolysin III